MLQSPILSKIWQRQAFLFIVDHVENILLKLNSNKSELGWLSSRIDEGLTESPWSNYVYYYSELGEIFGKILAMAIWFKWLYFCCLAPWVIFVIEWSEDQIISYYLRYISTLLGLTPKFHRKLPMVLPYGIVVILYYYAILYRFLK